MEDFFPNQRYTSKGEPELGIGILTEVGNRKVQVYFPLSNEKRHSKRRRRNPRWINRVS